MINSFMSIRKYINIFEGVDEPTHLTDDEKKVIEHLTDAYNMFVSLPRQHPSDTEDFSRHIHILQRHVMARLARRMHPEMFYKD